MIDGIMTDWLSVDIKDGEGKPFYTFEDLRAECTGYDTGEFYGIDAIVSCDRMGEGRLTSGPIFDMLSFAIQRQHMDELEKACHAERAMNHP